MSGPIDGSDFSFAAFNRSAVERLTGTAALPHQKEYPSASRGLEADYSSRRSGHVEREHSRSGAGPDRDEIRVAVCASVRALRARLLRQHSNDPGLAVMRDNCGVGQAIKTGGEMPAEQVVLCENPRPFNQCSKP